MTAALQRSRMASFPTWPAAIGQERHFAYQHRFPASAAFNIPIATLLHGPLEIDALEAALRHVLDRHEALRSTYEPSPGGLVMRIHSPASIPFRVIDLGLRRAADQVAEVARLGMAESGQPFDLTREPATRVTVVRCNPQEHVLFSTVHHIAFDGWSVPLLLDELSTTYGALVAGRPDPVQPPSSRYVDFSRSQRRELRSPAYDVQLEYWRRLLAGPPDPIPWPSAGSEPAAPWWAGDIGWVDIPPQLVDRTARFALERRTTIFSALLAAFYLMLQRVTGRTDLTVGVPFAGRQRSEWQQVIGFFVNTLVLRQRLGDVPTFDQLVARCHRAVVDGFANQDVPFGTVLDRVNPPLHEERTPLFQCMLVLQNTPSPGGTMGPAAARTSKIFTGCAKYDLTFSFARSRTGMFLELEHRRKFLGQPAANRLAAEFFGLLDAALAAPGMPLPRLAPAPVEITVLRKDDVGRGSLDDLFAAVIADWRR